MIGRTLNQHARGLAARAAARVAARAARVRRTGESGFILLESIIVIALITVIMSAVGAEYVSGLASTNNARFQAVAVEIAGSTVDQIQALHASDLITGRGSSAVNTERSAVANFTTLASTSYEAYDPTVSASNTGTTFSTLATPTTVGTKTYSIYTYFECTAPTLGSVGCVTTSSQTSLTSDNIRAIVVVAWPQNGCPTQTITTSSGTTTGPTCSYSTSTIINTDSDPTFDLNQVLPVAPAIMNPSSLTVAVGDVISYQMGVTSNTGVSPFTWALTSGSLPAGLSINSAGLITGTVTTPTPATASPYTSTITVSDAFQRTASDTITWTVEPALTITQLSAQTGFVGASVNQTLNATGGSGSGYTFSDPNATLPAGLSISSSGVISGTLQSPSKTYAVTITATDSQACPACKTTPRTTTMSFPWTVTLPPLGQSNPGPQRWTVSTALSATYNTAVQMTATGGDGKYTWSASALPSGVSINSSTGLITGTPSATGSGTASVTVSDPTAGSGFVNTITFSWTVFAAPTITAPAAQTTSKGGTATVAVSATCPNTACTYTAANLPAGLTINASTGTISGTVAATATTSTTATVTITDAAGASATSPSFTWTVLAAPTLGALGSRNYTETQTESSAVTYTCPAGSCTLTLSNSIPGLGLTTSATASGNLTSNTSLTVTGTSGTVYIGGTVQNSAVVGTATTASYTPSVTIATTTDGASSTTSATWTAYVVPTVTATGPFVTALGATPSVTFASTCANAGCTFALLNGPPGLSINSSGQVTGSVSGTTSAIYSNATVSITDANGVVQTSGTFTWAVTTTLQAAANNVGVTKASTVASGLFDQPGGTASSAHDSFSYENMTVTGSTTPITAAAPFTLTSPSTDYYTWPATAGSGSADNVIANGQVIAYSGRGATNIGFVYGSHSGTASGTVSIVYTDGSSTSASLSAPVWTASATTYALTSKENKIAAGAPASSVTTSGSVYLFQTQVAINTAKQVAYIVLPTSSTMHVFAISQPPLQSFFNTVGISTAGTASVGNLDGNNYSLDYEAIVANGGPTASASVTAGGLTYEWPNPAGTGAVDTVAPTTGMKIPFTASGSGSLGFLVDGVNGAAAASGGVVTYTDGTTTTFTLSSDDWCVHNSAPVAFTQTARYYRTGPSSIGVYVYYATVAVNASKTIASITLPTTSSGGGLRIFSIGYGS